ncbi:MAG: hypothetical protein BRD49_05570 [Bacteroidetes bacterium SW_10_40_5]|nr:MAG: hypothetical protein BRD49_05570 [Bacteroidetes bacterium SW_10_40_5]
MFGKILNTFFSKTLAALFNFLTIILTAQYLGAEGKGITSLIVVNISIIILVNDIVGGPSFVYLAPREKTLRLITPAYIWAAISAAITGFILSFFSGFPTYINLHVAFLGFLQSLVSVNIAILSGKEQIKEANAAFLSRAGIILGTLLLAFVLLDHIKVMSFVYAWYGGTILSFLLSMLYLKPFLITTSLQGIQRLLRTVFRYGAIIQTGNILQFLNYRISYYLLSYLIGNAQVGIYSIAIAIAEAVLLIAKSFSYVQYARISNLNNQESAKKLTYLLMPASFWITLIGLGILGSLPGPLFQWVFGPEFKGINHLLWLLSPGILAMGINTILSHYFSGHGKFYINAIGSGIGFILTLTACYVLIPIYGTQGAAISASIAYASTMIFTLTMFKMETNFSWNIFLLKKNDIEILKEQFKSLRK